MILGKPNHTEKLRILCTENEIELTKLPTHIAIIMDGNGRWAKKRNFPRIFGHKQGVESLRNVIKASIDFGIKYLSVYAFSTENWKRPKDEVSFLMKLIETLVVKEVPALKKNGVRIKFYGFFDELSDAVNKSISKSEAETTDNTTLQVNIMLNYGSRKEITNAVEKIVKNNQPITEESISENLLTYDIPDPDILIRPGGEHRISNFLLWQLSYAEFFFTDTLWPDFSREHLIAILQQFSQRERRYGGLV